MEVSVSANMGERCSREQHRFRVGVDSSAATEFVAGKDTFLEQLTNALLDHGLAGRPGKTSLFLQVWTGTASKWRNLSKYFADSSPRFLVQGEKFTKIKGETFAKRADQWRNRFGRLMLKAFGVSLLDSSTRFDGGRYRQPRRRCHCPRLQRQGHKPSITTVRHCRMTSPRGRRRPS